MNIGPNENINEQRDHRRLDINMALEYHHIAQSKCSLGRSVTNNICTGGVYFETNSDNIKPGDNLALQISIDGDENMYPAHSRFSTTATVLRAVRLGDEQAGDSGRYGIAAKFTKRFSFNF